METNKQTNKQREKRDRRVWVPGVGEGCKNYLPVFLVSLASSSAVLEFLSLLRETKHHPTVYKSSK